MRSLSKWKRFCFLFAAVLLLSGLVPAAAEAGEAFSQVMDMAGLLQEEEVQSLKEDVRELEAAAGWDVITATISDSGGKDAGTCAETLFDQNCAGDDGIICLIDMDNREIVLRTFGEAIDYLSDDRIDEILDEAYEKVSDGEYADCLSVMVKGARKAYNRGVPRGQYIYDEDTGERVSYRRAHRRITWVEALIALGAAVAAGGITAGAVVGKYRLKWGGYQYSCRENGRVELKVSRDTLVNQVVTHRRIPKDPPRSSGGGSRSTVHRGAGGRVSGGGSRKF